MQFTQRMNTECPRGGRDTNLDQPYATHQNKAVNKSISESVSGRTQEKQRILLPFHSSTVCSLSSSCLSVITGGGWKKKKKERHFLYFTVLHR